MSSIGWCTSVIRKNSNGKIRRLDRCLIAEKSDHRIVFASPHFESTKLAVLLSDFSYLNDHNLNRQNKIVKFFIIVKVIVENVFVNILL